MKDRCSERAPRSAVMQWLLTECTDTHSQTYMWMWEWMWIYSWTNLGLFYPTAQSSLNWMTHIQRNIFSIFDFFKMIHAFIKLWLKYHLQSPRACCLISAKYVNIGNESRYGLLLSNLHMYLVGNFKQLPNMFGSFICFSSVQTDTEQIL